MRVLIMLVMVTMVKMVVPQCLTDDDGIRVFGLNQELDEVMDFGLDLYKSLDFEVRPSFFSQGKNLIFSPYSIWSTLIIAYLGSGGNTERELMRALRVEDKIEVLSKWWMLESIFDIRSHTSSRYTFSTASQLYVDSNYPIRACVSDMLYRMFQQIEFSNVGGAARKINDFVSSTTNGKITEILQESDLLDAGMVLVNAAYFKGLWKSPFSAAASFRAPFKGDGIFGENVPRNVTLMSQTRDFKFGESKELRAKILELPYQGNDFSMFLILPEVEGPIGFYSTVERLSSSTLKKAMEKLKLTKVKVQMPSFNMSTDLINEMEPALKNIGIHDFFDATVANFTSFIPTQKVTVSQTVAKAIIEVNEKGSEAAAATAIVIDLRTKAPKVQEFLCDRPFMFFIFDNDLKNIIFFGVFRDPGNV